MMSVIEIFAIVSHALACLVALTLALCNINRMTAATCHAIRFAVGAVAVGAFAGLAADLLLHRVPYLPEWLIMAGVAVGLLADRRQSVCPCAFKTITSRSPHEPA